MRIILKILTVVLLIYALLWTGLFVYFNYAERHKGLLETNLSSLFDRDVSIRTVRTDWSGMSPVIQITGFRVAGDSEQQPALAFESLWAEFSITSIFRLWPKLTEFAVERPQLEIVSLPSNRLQIAGIELRPNSDVGINPRRLISWLLNHQGAAWHDGEIVWQRRNGDIQRYDNISFVYQRQNQQRSISAAIQTENGPFAFTAESRGDILAAKDWDASLEVLGDKGQQLLAPQNLSLTVKKGVGHLQLKALKIQRIRDFLLLTGLGEAAKWVLDAQLSGSLRDVEFKFSGPFLAFETWNLKAIASQVGFIATGSSPGMSGLAGKVDASIKGGVFEFSAEDTEFSWPKLFAQNFAIDRAAGQFRWTISENGKVEIRLEKGEFEDSLAKIWDLSANCNIDNKSRDIFHLAQVFKEDSLADLAYEDGNVVSRSPSSAARLAPLRLDARANFSIKDMAGLERYLPNDTRVDKFRKWWENAFLQGSISNGSASYVGELSATALATGQAKLLASADFNDVEIDYGYQRQWPILHSATGSATLDNDLISIAPAEAWIGDDEIFDGKVAISSLFKKSRTLDLKASTITTLPRLMEFLFDGPLLKPEQRGKPLPITASEGRVSAELAVSIPLAKVVDTTVIGSASLNNGEFLLPQQVPISNVSADINFTERSVTSNNISAEFLNGKSNAKLVTTEETQPPKMKITATGNGEVKHLEPWIGEHVLSWFDGRTDWQGEIAIDGPRVTIEVDSELQGIEVSAPKPLAKASDNVQPFALMMQLGSKKVQQQLTVEYGNYLRAEFAGDLVADNSLFDRSLIRLADEQSRQNLKLAPGINYLIDYNQLDIDAWLDAVIELAQLPTKPVDVPNTEFLDAMRSVNIKTLDPQLFGRSFGPINTKAISVDGANWIASIKGDNISGSLAAEPRAPTGKYNFKFDKLHVPKSSKQPEMPAAIDKSLEPSQYPRFDLIAESFQYAGKQLGKLTLSGAPNDGSWMLNNFELLDQGIRTTATGQWRNDQQLSSISNFKTHTIIDEAGEVLDELEFAGLLKKGDGKLVGTLNWIGAPHEFDFSRLNGEYDFHIDDGELVKVESGSGKLIGLLNSNALLRRLTLDFRDVFSSGLQFDRMRFAGLLANGVAILRDAYILTPSVFIQMEGKLDLGKELIDMEFHVSPELGGNLALLSALANPAAGAVVFLTQKLFKDEMRATSFIDYRALGTWEEFEIEEIGKDEPEDSQNRQVESAPDSAEPLSTDNKSTDLGARRFGDGSSQLAAER